MKRSQRVVLILSGALVGAGALTGCDSNSPPEIRQDTTYTNNTYVPGAGYYHAPYHSWFPFPYNSYQAGSGYYHGGNWSSQPNESPLTASRPTAASVQAANLSARAAARSSSVSRGGFGGLVRSIGS